MKDQGKTETMTSETLFLSDMCGALAVTVNETMNVMYDRACRIETLISDLPSLDVLDDIMIQLCGYCSLESCLVGFPSHILGKYYMCLVDDEKRNKKNGTTISDQYVQVFESLITARKRSLGQGNVFTPVCLFTGGICIQGVSASGGVCIWGVCIQGCWTDPPFSDTTDIVNERAVRILLECILVSHKLKILVTISR